MHTDHLGSPFAVTDESGEVVGTQAFYPFGEKRTGTGIFDTERGFTGQIRDAATGLNFYNARYQDPILGRFISPDSIVPNPFNPGLFNRFGYVSNNPLLYTDPSGFSCEGGSVDDPVACEFVGGSNTTNNPFAAPTLSAAYVGPPAPNAWAVLWEDTGDMVHVALDVAGSVPGIGEPADLLNAAIYALEGDYVNAALSAGAAIPAAGIAATVTKYRKGGSLVTGTDESADAISGIYELTYSDGTKYVGQSGNIGQRLKQHANNPELSGWESQKVIQVDGNKTTREIAEHNRIQQVTNGVRAADSPAVRNKRDPIGPKRQHLINRHIAQINEGY